MKKFNKKILSITILIMVFTGLNYIGAVSAAVSTSYPQIVNRNVYFPSIDPLESKMIEYHTKIYKNKDVIVSAKLYIQSKSASGGYYWRPLIYKELTIKRKNKNSISLKRLWIKYDTNTQPKIFGIIDTVKLSKKMSIMDWYTKNFKIYLSKEALESDYLKIK
ncbi:MAG: hypothetical protein QMD61_00155 [Methanobacterium sp.]|nr:hypothetical protein [Methanobacterium sp.]